MATTDDQPEEKTTRMPLRGRAAIVIGASGGLGREIALHLAEKGARVVVHYSSTQHSAEEVASIINNNSSHGVRASVCKADVAEPSQVAQLFDMAEQTFGPLHIVVNSAGFLDPKYLSLAETSEEDWDRTFNINCKGAFLCSREAANRVVRGGGGRIINISSSSVGLAIPRFGAYAASKAAVEMMTRILAQELRGTQITANCVAPGPIATDMFFAGKSEAAIELGIKASPFERLGKVATDMFFAGKSEAAIELGIKASPFERLGKVEDVAPLVAFLVSDEGEWVNAQVVRVNGGQV